jgi:hypothetical protein
MSQENVELVRKSWEGLMRGDSGALSVFDPDVIYEDDLLPDDVGETYHGIEGVMKAWALWAQPWEDLETGMEWVRDAGDEVCPATWRACGARGAG